MTYKILNKILLVILLITILSFILGIRPMIIMSGSMQPTLKTGSLCFVNTNTDINHVKAKDIITFCLLDGKVTHRAVNITKEGIITKGDANSVEDLGVVTKRNFYGKVLFSMPYMGFIFFYIRKHWIVCMGISMVFVLIPWKYILNKLQKIKRRRC